MIDKKIFYCWFGNGEMSDLDKKCMESWKKFCPDYEIVRISEENYDWNSNPYAKMHYECGNWSGVSNAARLEFLKRYSGFYLDTDVQLLKPLDELRVYDEGFITEFECSQPDSGVLGRGSVFPKYYEEVYERLVPGTVLHKEFIQVMYRDYDVHGQSQQTFADGFTVLGEEYFPTANTGLITENTIGIHYFENTWKKTAPDPTDGFYPYQRMEIFVGNKMIRKEKGANIRVKIKNHRKKISDEDMIFRMNYFFNPRVVKLVDHNFDAERINYNRLKPTENIVTPSGLIVYFQ